MDREDVDGIQKHYKDENKERVGEAEERVRCAISKTMKTPKPLSLPPLPHLKLEKKYDRLNALQRAYDEICGERDVQLAKIALAMAELRSDIACEKSKIEDTILKRNPEHMERRSQQALRRNIRGILFVQAMEQVMRINGLLTDEEYQCVVDCCVYTTACFHQNRKRYSGYTGRTINVSFPMGEPRFEREVRTFYLLPRDEDNVCVLSAKPEDVPLSPEVSYRNWEYSPTSPIYEIPWSP